MTIPLKCVYVEIECIGATRCRSRNWHTRHRKPSGIDSPITHSRVRCGASALHLYTSGRGLFSLHTASVQPRYHAQEAKRRITSIAELVHFIGSDIDAVAGLNWSLGFAFEHDARSFEHVDLVFIRVMMMRSEPAGLHFELPHDEIGRSVGFADQ